MTNGKYRTGTPNDWIVEYQLYGLWHHWRKNLTEDRARNLMKSMRMASSEYYRFAACALRARRAS